MAMTVSQVKVWSATIDDRPGGLAGKLEALAKAGANLEFVIARRAPDKPGTGVVFVTPIEGDAVVKAAQKAGFSVSESLHSVRAEGPDAPGLGARMTATLAKAGINLRGLSAAAIGKRIVCHLALDTAQDATKAVDLLKAL
jgi:hypothetical protein